MSVINALPQRGGVLVVRSITVTLSNSTRSTSITAPTVSGYRFVCWIGSATTGWIGSTYIENMANANTAVWDVASSGNRGSVICWALFQKI